jgi:hypothetical protein
LEEDEWNRLEASDTAAGFDVPSPSDFPRRGSIDPRTGLTPIETRNAARFADGLLSIVRFAKWVFWFFVVMFVVLVLFISSH